MAAVDYTGGWVKIWRKTMQSQMYRSLTSAQRDVMMVCLMLANHEEKEWEWGAKVFKCAPGQFITSLESLKEYCAKDVSIKQIRGAIEKLEKWDFLANESAKTGRLITVNNWAFYQDQGQTEGQTDGQTQGKHRATTEEGKEGKEGKKKSRGTASVPNPGFSDHFMTEVWPYFARHKKGPYKSIETQGVAIRQLFEMSAGNEEAAKQALRETLTNNYQGFTWYFDRKGGTNGKTATTADRKGVSAEEFQRSVERFKTHPGLRRANG